MTTKTIIAIGAFAFFIIMPGKTSQAQSANDSMTITRERTFGDHDKSIQIVDAKDEQGRNFRVVIENDVVKAFYVNDKKVPIENIVKYEPVVKKIDDQLNIQHQLQQRSSREHYVQDSLMYAAEEEKRKKAAEIQLEAIRARYSKDSLKYIADIMERGKKYGWPQLPKWERDIYDSVMYAADLKESKRRESEQEDLINDLIRDAIIKDRASLSSFRLGAGSFIVNGENQSFEIYDRYKSKYIKTPDEVYSFNPPVRKN